MKRITSELEGLRLYLERRIGTLQHPEGNTHDLWRTNRNSPILLSLLFRKVFFNILEKIYWTPYLVKLHQMFVATTGSTDRQNVNPLREPDPNLDILKKYPQLFLKKYPQLFLRNIHNCFADNRFSPRDLTLSSYI